MELVPYVDDHESALDQLRFERSEQAEIRPAEPPIEPETSRGSSNLPEIVAPSPHQRLTVADLLLCSLRSPSSPSLSLRSPRVPPAGGFGAKGIVAGTPWYMSPEQAAGTAHRIEGRTGIYSPGVVLYEMLTAPFRATHIPEVLRQVRDDEPQPPRQLVGEVPLLV